jgi:MerR family copper efflux transcriptional regulator
MPAVERRVEGTAAMNIGQLARLAGVPIDTVRYYERNGLLPTPARRTSGYRNYQASDVERLRFVRRAKVLGFSLTEIGELLQLWELRTNGAAEFKAVATARLAEVDHKLDELARLRGGLHRLLASATSDLRRCPVLQSLSEEP